MSLTRLLREVRACQICSANLPLGPRPVLQLASSARLLIIGQAPGSKVHLSGIPWSDLSGDRLRDWMKLDRSVFYDKTRVAILPIGFCYPGAGENRGDLPPRPECAPLWHERLLKHLPNLEVTVLVGQYAQQHYLRSQRRQVSAA
jgi:uracil-DNA glycosylase